MGKKCVCKESILTSKPNLISTFNLKKSLHKGEVSHCFMIQLLTPSENTSSIQPTLHSFHSATTTPSLLPSSDTHPEITQILNSYSDIFDEPKQLPRTRSFDHRIPLEPNAKPVNVRPYRFPHFQKNKIENQVQQMLDLGIVRPSSSAYSSPVILVKKKMVPGVYA